ncbi:hypothetical protein [Rivibacter subsaxonicus]|uniref:Uncharacterized protein n=1 Tax=Rivibacter subsaxonicus TaxID=457575 RepID=A0A4V2FUH9_9BURK|nr:hypothetical protein [Rivibacter subsaxonicus]RZU02126.1 hypothetical protein EV670_0145 [Rivibacter subsaxonicus]
MPEQLTKHPEITITVLKSAGAQCAEGARQDILRACPAARFCKLPGGELCVYGLPEATSMTQIDSADWSALRGATQDGGSAALPAATGLALPAASGLALLAAMALALMALGIAIGWRLARRRPPR